MNSKQLMRRLALGTVAGMAGTCAVQGLRMASQKWLPETMPTFRKEPGMFMLEKAEDLLPPPVSGQVPSQVKTAAARVLGLGYGSAFGAFYATLDPGGAQHRGRWDSARVHDMGDRLSGLASSAWTDATSEAAEFWGGGRTPTPAYMLWRRDRLRLPAINGWSDCVADNKA